MTTASLALDPLTVSLDILALLLLMAGVEVAHRPLARWRRRRKAKRG